MIGAERYIVQEFRWHCIWNRHSHWTEAKALQCSARHEEVRQRKDIAFNKRQGFTHVERDEVMAHMREEGVTLQAIGDRFNLSRERVRQAILKHDRRIKAECSRLFQHSDVLQMIVDQLEAK